MSMSWHSNADLLVASSSRSSTGCFDKLIVVVEQHDSETARPSDRQNVAVSITSGEYPPGIGCGVFLILAGLGMFADQMGWLPGGNWVLPALLVTWGISILYSHWRNRR